MNLLTTSSGKQFKRDFRRCKKRNYDMSKLEKIIDKLANRQPLEPKNKNHALSGDWEPARDCHVENDWVLIYRVNGSSLELIRTGTHSDLGL